MDEWRKNLIPTKKQQKGNVQREYAKHILEIYGYPEEEIKRRFYRPCRKNSELEGLGEASVRKRRET